MLRTLFWMITVSLAVLTSLCPAADIIWSNSTGNGLWTTAANWNPPYVPAIAFQDKAKISRMDGPLISDGMAAECQWLAIADNAPAEMHMTGGTLNVSGTGDSWTIIAYYPADIGTFTIDGGVITTSNRVFVGFQGTGTIIMNGGTMNIGGTFGIGYGETSFNTGKGYVYLNGGTINASGTFIMSSPTGAVGRLDLAGGTLNLTGDKRTTVNGYISSGYIVAFNGMGIVKVQYDGTKTILTGEMDPKLARVPQPGNNAADVAPYASLGWMAGDTAVTQDVYFGTDSAAVLDATRSTTGIYMGSQPRENCTFDPANLVLGTKYYWRIDSVEEPNIYKGNLWQFTVADYALVDDFQRYADSAAMSASWSVGTTAGALSLSASGGQDGSKGMQFNFDNSGAGGKPFYSEARSIGIDEDWTISGVLAIDIWYKGAASNASEPMYAALEDNDGNPVAVVVNEDAGAALATDWQVWRIALSDFAGINLDNIKAFSVGFGNRVSPAAGGSGTVYFDNIALFPSRCLYDLDEDINKDCFVDFADFAIMAQNWLAVSEL